jgi:hypothetical protein
MGETVNIGAIANKLSEDIFNYFGWQAHQKRDDNFACCTETHFVESTAKKSKSPKGKVEEKSKKTHPGDVVFFYQDPYLGKRIYLHTDLKSYAKNSISVQKVRSAIYSLAMSVECARKSEDWRGKYSVPKDVRFDVRGLLFVHNHDGLFKNGFDEIVQKTKLSTIPIGQSVYVHFLGPNDISRLFTIANDIVRLQHQRTLPEKYSFYYPDLMLWHRHGDLLNQPATIEALTAPYFIVIYEMGEKTPPGYLIYYNRAGDSVDEFVYFLDSLSRYQMLETGKLIRIRMVASSIADDYKSHFQSAKDKYAKAWGFDSSRVQVLEDIEISPVTAVTTTLNAPDMGWKERK